MSEGNGETDLPDQAQGGRIAKFPVEYREGWLTCVHRMATWSYEPCHWSTCSVITSSTIGGCEGRVVVCQVSFYCLIVTAGELRFRHCQKIVVDGAEDGWESK